MLSFGEFAQREYKYLGSTDEGSHFGTVWHKLQAKCCGDVGEDEDYDH